MTQVSAHYTCNHFAEIIDMSQREPVEIAKHGRIVSILMSKNEYDSMRHIMDEWWMSAAHTAISADSQEEQLKNFNDLLRMQSRGEALSETY